MNVYLHELKANRKFALIWLIVILCISLLMISFYPTISKDIDFFVKMMDNYPKSIRDAFGMNLDIMGSVLGYYASFPLTLLLICGSMEAMIIGVSILSKETRDKTADFLFTKPLSRTKIITAKILAVVTLIVITNIIFLASAYIILLSFASVPFAFDIFVLLTLKIFLIQLLFFTIGMLISVILPKVKSPLPISMGVVFGFYALSTFGDVKMQLLMPFKYFDSIYILENAQYELKYIIATFLVIVISTALTYVIYKKKDIHSV